MTRILVLDNHRLFGIGVKYFLEASLLDTQVETAQSYARAHSRLEQAHFALLLLEIGTTKDDGLKSLGRLRSGHPRLPILVLSDCPVGYYGPRAIRAGACGFLEKSSAPEDLLAAVKCVLNGKHYIGPELADRLARALHVGRDANAPHEALSPREFQIFRRLALGESVTQVARALNLSVKTVSTHSTRIYQKMGTEKRGDLTQYAFDRGLIPSRRLGEKNTLQVEVDPGWESHPL